jgi:hypothetical protein
MCPQKKKKKKKTHLAPMYFAGRPSASTQSGQGSPAAWDVWNTDMKNLQEQKK